MDSLLGFDVPIFTICIHLDIPTIKKCVQEKVDTSNYPFPQSIAKEVKKIVSTEHFIHALCEKFDLLPVNIYEDFEKIWLKKRLFHRENSLQTILQNYEKQFRLTKALKKAAKYSRFDFVNDILNSKRLWCSYRHIRDVCLGCCWSKEKVDSYLVNLHVKHFNDFDEDDSRRDISAHCKTRATLRGYENSGYEIDEDIYLDLLFVSQRWDLVRSKIDELREDRISLPTICVEYGNDKIYRNQDLIPEDLREYVDITTIEQALYDLEEGGHFVKSLKLFGVTPDMIQDDHPCFQLTDRVQNLWKAQWLNDNGFEDSERRPILDFMLMYKNNQEISSRDMPLFSANYSPTDDYDMHSERCTEFVIWCLEEKLHLDSRFALRVKQNMMYVFEVLLATENFYDEDIHADWYDPLNIQYFCENHLVEFSTFCGSKDILKERLLNRVKGDMEKYISEL